MNMYEGNGYWKERQFQKGKKFLCNPLKAREDFFENLTKRKKVFKNLLVTPLS